MGLAWRVALLLWALYLLTYNGGPHAVDEIGQLGVTASLVKRGSLDANELYWTIPAAGYRSDAQVEIGVTGEVWSVRGPALPIAMAPWYALGWLVPGLDITFATLLAMGLVSAATAGLLTHFGRRLGLAPPGAVAAGLLYGVAGLAWPYARLGFGEPLIALAVVGAAASGAAGPWGAALAGGFVVLAAATKWSAAALGAPVGLYVLFAEPFARERAWLVRALGRSIAFGAVAALGLAALGYLNWVHFGSPLNTGYELAGREEFTTAPWYGLAGLLVSAYRGIVWFAPAALAGALVLPTAYRRAPGIAFLAAAVALVTLATFAAWWTWWGGYTWGPRFLLPISPLLVLMVPLAWPRLTRTWRRLVGVLVVLSVLVQLPGVLVDFNPFEKALRLARPDFPRSGAMWGLSASPIVAHVERLLREQTCALDLAWLRCGHVDPLLGVALFAPLVLALLALWWRGWLFDAVAAAALVVGIGALLARGPIAPNASQADLLALAEVRGGLARPGDGTLVLASPEVPVLWSFDRWRGATYGFNRDDLPGNAEAQKLLDLAARRHARLWLMAANVPREDPLNGVEPWLEQHAFSAGDRSIGAARLRLFLTGEQALSPAGPPLASFGGGEVVLAGARLLDTTVGPDSPARLQLLWRPGPGGGRDLNVFVHLYVDGRLVGQIDAPLTPSGHYAPRLVEPSQAAEVSVEVGVYRGDGRRLEATLPNGQLAPENRVVLGRLARVD